MHTTNWKKKEENITILISQLIHINTYSATWKNLDTIHTLINRAEIFSNWLRIVIAFTQFHPMENNEVKNKYLPLIHVNISIFSPQNAIDLILIHLPHLTFTFSQPTTKPMAKVDFGYFPAKWIENPTKHQNKKKTKKKNKNRKTTNDYERNEHQNRLLLCWLKWFLTSQNSKSIEMNWKLFCSFGSFISFLIVFFFLLFFRSFLLLVCAAKKSLILLNQTEN